MSEGRPGPGWARRLDFLNLAVQGEAPVDPDPVGGLVDVLGGPHPGFPSDLLGLLVARQNRARRR